MLQKKYKRLFRSRRRVLLSLRVAYHWSRMKYHQKHMVRLPAGSKQHRKHMEKYGKHHTKWHRLTTGFDFI